MAITTGISWASSTWNPWMGCHKVSQGCSKCYMFRDMKRFGRNPDVVMRATDHTFNYPLLWQKSGSLPAGSRIFVCSWSDFFVKEADTWRQEAWDIIRKCPEYNFLITTKRIERAYTCLPPDWGSGWNNVWLGVSAEDQKNFDERYGILTMVPAHIKWISAEPLLGPIKFPIYTFINWIVTGGESDPVNPRLVDLQLFRDIRDYCKANHISYFHKQHGGSKKIDGVWGGKYIDGTAYEEFPDTIGA